MPRKQHQSEFDISTGLGSAVQPDNSLKLVLPFPPTINHYYGQRNGRMFVDSDANKFRADVLHECCKITGERDPMNGRLIMGVCLNNKTNRTYDLDNRIKALQDALTKSAVWHDDSQIDRMIVVRGRPIKGGRCVVLVHETDGKTPEQQMLELYTTLRSYE